jgi:ketosteroid isomerase-like protein
MPGETPAPLAEMLRAFEDRGIDAALEYVDPEIEWRAPPEWLEERLYRGHAGIRRLAAFWAQQFDQFRLRPERFIDLGDDRVLALLRQEGIIRGSGDRVEQAVGWICEIRDRKLTKVEVHFSWEDALEAAGVGEG